MTDNTELDLASGGDVIASDDISGVKHQRVKVEWGPDGTANEVDAASGKALPVQGEAAENAAVTGNPVLVAGRFDSVARILGDGDVGAIALDASGAINVAGYAAEGAALGLGVLLQGDDGTDRKNINVDATTGNLQVDVINTVTVDGSGVTQPISAAALPLPSGAATEAAQLADGHNVTVDNAAGGSAVNIQDGGNSLTVDNGGSFATQVDGDALIALQLIDDPVFADDDPFTLTSSKIMIGGGIRDDTLSTLTAVEGDAIPFRFGSTGALHVTGAGGGVQFNISDVLGATDTVTLAGVVRDDSLTTLTEADGDISVLRVSSVGALHVTGGGGGTEYNEDDVTPNPIVGTATLMERDDALTTITPAEGDWAGLRGSAEGALWTQDFNSDAMLADLTTVAGAVDSTAMKVKPDNTISTNNSSTTPLGVSGVFTGTGEDVSDYSVITLQMHASHDSATDGISPQFSIDNTNWDDADLVFTYTAADGARRFQVPVTGQYFRLVYTNGGTGQTHFRLQAILHRMPVNTTIHRLVDSVDPDRSAELIKSAIIAQAAGSGDFVPVQATAAGNLKNSVEEIDASLLGGGVEADALLVTIANDSTGLVSVDDNGGSLTVDAAGDVAHDAADSGNPIKIGAKATNAIEGLTQVAADDRTDLRADLNGVLLTRNATTLEELISGSQSNTDGTEDAVTAFAAGGAGVHNYITSVTIHNAHASTNGFVELLDGTGGTTMWVFPAPAGGGTTHNFNPPLKQATANTQLFFDPSAAITTIYVSINGFQAQG